MRTLFLILFSYFGLHAQENIDLKKAENLYDLGKGAYYDGDYDRALSYLDSCLTIAHSVLKRPNKFLMRAEQRTGNSARKFRDYPKAEKHLKLALAEGIALYGEEHDRVAGIMSDLGILSEKIGLYSQAIKWFESAIEVKKKLHGDDSKEVAFIKMNMAQTYYARGNYTKCISENFDVLETYNKSLEKDNQNYNRVYLAMSNAYRKKGDLENALEFGLKSLEIKLKNYDTEHPSVSKYYDNVAKVLVELGQIDESKKYFSKSRRILEMLGDTGQLGSFINDEARIYMVSGQFDVAYEQFEEVLSLIGSEGHKVYNTKYNMAICLYEMGEKEKAFELLNDQLVYINDSDIYLKLSKWARRQGSLVEARSYAEKGKDLVSKGDDLSVIEYLVNDSRLSAYENLDTAWFQVNEAIELLIRLRRNYSGDYSKNFINEELESIFEWAVELGKERWKVLPDESQFEDLFHMVEKAKAASFWDDLSEDNAYYYGGVPDKILEKIEILKEGGVESKVELESKLEALRADYPEYYLKKYSLEVPSLKLVQTQLKKKMAVLDYFVLKEDVIALYISKDEVKVISYENDGTITFKEELEKVSNEIERISIVPHKFIHFVAFDQLKNASSGEYLLYDYAFSYQINIRGMMTDKVVEKSENYLGFVPSWESEYMNEEVSRGSLQSLPGAKREVTQVAELFNGVVFDKNEASETAFYRDAPKFDLLHFATHAQVDPDNELNSVLYLHPESDQQDGLLEMDEIMATKLNASLVILSACETGAGGLQSGEGVMSLARAFQYAGARSVLMSLWRANDRSAHPIIYHFIENYRNGKDKDVALQLSKIKFIEEADPLLRSEFYWAGFMISGDLETYDGSRNKYKYLFAIIGLLILLFLLYRFALTNRNSYVGQ